jgi:hypothetical protein
VSWMILRGSVFSGMIWYKGMVSSEQLGKKRKAYEVHNAKQTLSRQGKGNRASNQSWIKVGKVCVCEDKREGGERRVMAVKPGIF